MPKCPLLSEFTCTVASCLPEARLLNTFLACFRPIVRYGNSLIDGRLGSSLYSTVQHSKEFADEYLCDVESGVTHHGEKTHSSCTQ